jgi:hypothetical protein
MRQQHTSRHIIAIAVSIFTAVVTSAVQADPRIVPVGARPESVCRGFGGLYYVTLQGPAGGPAGDGGIAVIDGDTVRPFAVGMDDPKGIAFTGTHLVTADIKRVWIVDRWGEKRELATETSFPFPIAFLNDVAAERGGSVLVTEMGARTLMRDPATTFLWPIDSPQAAAIPATSRVYRIDSDGHVTVAVTPSREVLVMNGITTGHGNRLLAAEFFYGNITAIKNDEKTILATGFRGADGIEESQRKDIYVSSFEQGIVWKLCHGRGTPEVLLSGRGRFSTADIHLDESRGLLLVPDTLAGTVTFLRVGR